MIVLAWLAGLAAAVGAAAVGGLVNDEARARLEQIPYLLLTAAIRRLPAELRADVGEEWHAELDHILHRVEAYPLTRLLYGTCFAAGLLRAAPKIGRDLINARPARPDPELGPRRSRDHRARVRRGSPGAGVRRPAVRLHHVITVIAVCMAGTVIAEWEVGVAVALTVSVVIGVRQTLLARDPSAAARARTRRQLSRLQRCGYTSMHSRSVPGTGEIIDHLVIGPTGIYALSSQRWDPQFTARVRTADGDLYHGPASQAHELERAHSNAATVAALIASTSGMPIDVRAGLAVFGPKLFQDGAPLVGLARLRGVDVFMPWQTRTWLQNRPAVFSADVIQRLAAVAAQVLPACSPADNAFPHKTSKARSSPQG